MTFSAPLALSGPFRKPRQMLAHQEYGGHVSIHDDSMAEKLGFRAGPIEGPTHFSLFAPLVHRLWGQEWYERGCISAHYMNMVVEGEETRAFVEVPAEGARRALAWAEKGNAERILEASVSVGPEAGATLLEQRVGRLRAPEKLVILRDLHVGMRGAEEEIVRMDPDQHMGALYPFSLNQKLEAITEPSEWFTNDAASPWGRRIIPLEMVSVLAEYSSAKARWPVRGPAVGLFADQEIRMLEGPLFVGEEYLVRREIAALSESKRTESYWVRTRIYERSGRRQLAEVLLNHATLKNSFAGYELERATL